MEGQLRIYSYLMRFDPSSITHVGLTVAMYLLAIIGGCLVLRLMPNKLAWLSDPDIWMLPESEEAI